MLGAGAELFATLSGAGLIDDYRFLIAPVALGQGKAMFAQAHRAAAAPADRHAHVQPGERPHGVRSRAMSPGGHDLERFVTAQRDVYDGALAELRRGHKTGHWMWFIFPQVAGLGHSEMSRRYAIASLDEAPGLPRGSGPRGAGCASAPAWSWRRRRAYRRGDPRPDRCGRLRHR